MKGDFSQLDPRRDARYDAVLHQQGRVWLDSDWNADVFERLARTARETRDVVGTSGFPYPGNAFKIGNPTGNDPTDFTIGGGAGADGTAYVDGMRCELGAPATYTTQPDLPNAPPIAQPAVGETFRAVVYLSAWYRMISYLQDPAIREVALGGPDTAVRLKTIAQVLVTPPGSTALACKDAAAQLPPASAGTLSSHVVPPAPPADRCSLPDPEGYTGQANRLYRVEIHAAGDVAGAAGSNAFRTQLTTDAPKGATTLTVAPALTPAQSSALTVAKTAALTDASGLYAALAVASVSSNGAQITLSAGLAEAFATGATVSGGAAEFKWSRNNASDAVGIVPSASDAHLVTLASLGRDADTALRAGDLVEISDDATDLGPAAGFLTYLAADPDPDTLQAQLADPLPAALQNADPAMHPVLRRWDGRGFAAAAFDPVLTPDLSLQDGIYVTFGGTNGASNLDAGDYWTFTARSIDQSVEILTDALPAGIARSYVPLAIVSWTNTAGNVAFKLEADCRSIFSALADIPGRAPAITVQQLESVTSSGGKPVTFENDQPITPTKLAGGMRFVLDQAPNGDGVKAATCAASAELVDAQLQFAVEANLGGAWAIDGNAITWKISGDMSAALLALRKLAASAPGLPIRFRLHGACIWAASDPSLYLDGTVFGVARGDGTIDLPLPSGDGRRAADFATWASLVTDPQQALSVYAAIRDSKNPRVEALPATGLGSVRQLIDSNITASVRGVALDATGRIYVGNGISSSTSSVFVYPATMTGGSVATLTGLGFAFGITLDAQGNVYVADQSYTDPGTGKSFPAIVVYKPVPSGGGSFGPHTVFTSSSSLTQPVAVATDAAGFLYATNASQKPLIYSVVVFDQTGAVARTITGPTTGLSNPFGVAVDASGLTYVTNNNVTTPLQQSVTVYEAGASGDEAPVRTITGPSTQIGTAPIYDCALDPDGYLYVTCGNQVLVFAPGANGNATPLVVIAETPAPDTPTTFITVGP